MAFKLAKKTAAPAKKAVGKKTAAPKKAAAKPLPGSMRPAVVEDDDEYPADGPGTPSGERTGVVTSGWGGANEMGGASDFIKTLDFKNDAAKTKDTLWFIVKFLEDAPYANVKIHWTERKGKRSFICIGDDCPLCNVGADVKSEFRFNVAVFGEEEPILRSWSAGWKIYKKIRSLSESPLTKPLPKRIYLATRTGKVFNEIAYDLDKINEDEIAEAYPDIYVPSAEEIESISPYTLADVEKEYSTVSELEAVAAEIVEGE